MLTGLADTSMIIWRVATSLYDNFAEIAGRAMTSFYKVFYLPVYLPELVHMMAGFNSSKNKYEQSTLSSRIETHSIMFLYILLANTSQKASPDSRGGETDSIA